MRVRVSRGRDANGPTRSWLLPLSSAMAMTMAALTTACSVQGGGGGGGGGGEAEAKCAIVATYEGRSYTDVANVDFTVGDTLGTAEFPPCDDTPGNSDDAVGPESMTAYEVDGVDPRIAIAVRFAPDQATLLAVQPGGSLPPEIKALARG